MMLQGTMESEASFGFYVPPPFPPFSTPSPSGIDFFDDDNTFRPISDLEAHFTAHFNLEVESSFKNKSKEMSLQTFTNVNERLNSENEWFVDENEAFNNYHSNISVNIPQNTQVYGDNKHCKTKQLTTEHCKSYSNVETKFIYNSCFENFNEKSTGISETNISSVQNLDIYSQNELAYTSCDENDFVIEELSKIEDSDICRLSPNMLSDEFLNAIIREQNTLPPIEKAFSKQYYSYSSRDASIPKDSEMVYNNLDENTRVEEIPLYIDNLDNYSYPNNILNNITFEKYYQNAETNSMIGTDCSFTDYRSDRKVSVSDSIESDSHIDYLDDIEENIGYPENDKEFVLNLDDLGIHLEDVDDVFESNIETISVPKTKRKRLDSEDVSGEMVCYWETCNEVYENQVKLVEHIEKFHVNTYKGEEFSCLWSGCARERRPFNARYKLLIHMRVHSGHKPNRCTHPGCGKSFSRLENLKIHRRSHTGERPYGCGAPHCRKAFSNSSDRAKHQRTHFNARPYACQVKGCAKRYTDPSSLRKHVKNHNPSAISTLKISTKPLPEELPGYDLYDCHANDRRKHDENSGTSSNISRQSPVKLDTLKSIRNKIQEQKNAAINSEWNNEKRCGEWSCFEDNLKQGYV